MNQEPEYFINDGTELKGPYGVDGLRTELQAGRIKPQDMIAARGDAHWRPVGELFSQVDAPLAGTKPNAPELAQVHRILAVVAALLFLIHGGLDFWEWKVVWDDMGISEEIVPENTGEGFETEDAVAAAPVTEEEYIQAMPPKWVGALKAVIFPLALILTLAAEWRLERNWWRGAIGVFCLLEALLGLIYFLCWYEIGLTSEGILFGLSYILWSIHRVVLLLVWVSTHRIGWMAPVGLGALAMGFLMVMDIATFILVEPSMYGFSFLEDSIVQSVSEKLTDLGNFGTYCWLGAKMVLTGCALWLVLPLMMKQSPTR